jgi:hypothetical protein
MGNTCGACGCDGDNDNQTSVENTKIIVHSNRVVNAGSATNHGMLTERSDFAQYHQNNQRTQVLETDNSAMAAGQRKSGTKLHEFNQDSTGGHDFQGNTNTVEERPEYKFDNGAIY